MQNGLVLILGGARSGKSRFAEELAHRLGKRVLYLATAQAGDEEMAARITEHRDGRPNAWRTLEAPVRVGEAVLSDLQSSSAEVVLLDCLTFLVTNLILAGLEDPSREVELDSIDELAARARVRTELDELLDARRASGIPWIVVTNEVGSGLVPPYYLGRVFRDLQGWANQQLAAEADQVYLMVAGISLGLKGASTK